MSDCNKDKFEENLYSILGVSKAASEKEIKQAYKKLVLFSHPDKGGDTKTFTKIQQAYQVLRNQDTRQKYDTAHNCRTKPMQKGIHPPSSNSDGHIHKTLHISLNQLFVNDQIRIKYQRWVFCEDCDGYGEILKQHKHPCVLCNGRGYFVSTNLFGLEGNIGCHKCKGKGFHVVSQQYESCNHCETVGVFYRPNTILFSTAEYVTHEQKRTIQFIGKGNANVNGGYGNLIIHVKEHYKPDIYRKGIDLYVKKYITLYDALYGGTFDVENKKINVEPFVNNNDGLFLHSKRIQIKKGHGLFQQGDLILQLHVLCPELTNKQLQKDLKEMCQSVLNEKEI